MDTTTPDLYQVIMGNRLAVAEKWIITTLTTKAPVTKSQISEEVKTVRPGGN